MKHPFRWIFGGIAVVVVAALVIGGIYVFGGSAPAKPKLTACAGSSDGPSTPNGTWKVVPGSGVYVGYRVTEVFAGDVVHKSAVGRTPSVTGTMTIAGDQVTAATVSGDLRQLASDRSPRDNYIHTHAIESDKFPTTTFTLTAPITVPAPLTKGAPVHVSATGTLLLHGVTRPVTVPLDACWAGPTIQLTGTAPVAFADYKIVPPDTGVTKVDDHGSLELSLTFQES